jgi:hypothetical protein
MSIRLIAVLAGLSLAGASPTAQSAPNFAGTWTLDADKTAALLKAAPGSSRAGGGAASAGGMTAVQGGAGSSRAPEWVITQSPVALTIVRTLSTGTQQKFVYKLDGAESVNVNGRTTQTSRTTVSSGRLVTTGTQTVATDQGDLSSEFKEVRWLDKDGTMIVETTRTANGTSREVTQAFKRKQL